MLTYGMVKRRPKTSVIWRLGQIQEHR